MGEHRATRRVTFQQRVARALARHSTAARSERPARPRRDTPVNIAGQLPLIDGPNLRLAIVAIVKDEAPYLEEWLCYHLALGVQHVFLYDNGSTDDSPRVLEPFQNHGLVTVIDWPLPGSQTSAYSHALRLFGPSVDWLGFFDVDEFLVPVEDDDVPSLLARFGDVAILEVPRREFAFSGHRSPPAGLTIEAYTGIAHTDDRDTGPGPRIKALVQPRGVYAVEIHAASLADRFPDDTDPQGRPAPRRVIGRRQLQEVIQLNHYYTRSFEEFEAKRFRGSATGRLPRPAIPFDVSTTDTDTRAHRFVGRTSAMIERMRSLEPRPYIYGSALAFPEFPVFDDLGQFGEFAIANMAAGMTEAGRGPAMRFPNLWSGVGFIGDLSATAFRPGAAALSGSAHGEALFRHMRADLRAGLGTFDVVEGTIEDGSDRAAGAILRLAAGRARLVSPLELAGRRHCAAIGFVLGSAAPVRLRVNFADEDDVDDAAPVEPTVIELPTSDVVAGIVEVSSRPRLLSSVTIEVESVAEELDIADLFVSTYG